MNNIFKTTALIAGLTFGLTLHVSAGQDEQKGRMSVLKKALTKAAKPTTWMGTAGINGLLAWYLNQKNINSLNKRALSHTIATLGTPTLINLLENSSVKENPELAKHLISNYGLLTAMILGGFYAPSSLEKNVGLGIVTILWLITNNIGEFLSDPNTLIATLNSANIAHTAGSVVDTAGSALKLYNDFQGKKQ